jgi:hypothetical protein
MKGIIANMMQVLRPKWAMGVKEEEGASQAFTLLLTKAIDF